ncbi:MAG: glycosyltransferase [bacterium]
MRILYVIAALQHPKIRGATRHYHFVRELSKHHDITLLSLVRSSVEPEAISDIQSFTENLLTFNINGESSSALADKVARLPLVGSYLEKSLKLARGVNQMKEAFLNLAKRERFDLVLFHGKSIFSVIEKWSGLPIVTDFCDATSLRIRTSMRFHSVVKRPYYFFKWLSVRRLERKMVRKTPHVAFISKRDREAVLGPGDCSTLVPLGVDHEFWNRRVDHADSRSVVFTGVMDYAPNHDAAIHLIEKILPPLREKIPGVEIVIVGRNPKGVLRRKAEQTPGVTVTGFVDDVRPYLEKAAVFAAPIRFASGSQNKVLEAMAMKVPVVATPIVSDGLRIDEYGEPPLLKAADDEAFVEALGGLLEDEQERMRLSEAGYRFVEQYYDWSHSAARLEQICQAALTGQG